MARMSDAKETANDRGAGVKYVNSGKHVNLRSTLIYVFISCMSSYEIQTTCPLLNRQSASGRGQESRFWRNAHPVRTSPLRSHSVSRKKVPNARGPSPAGIFTVTLSVPESIAQTSFENQLTT